jgi:hypothetical protein
MKPQRTSGPGWAAIHSPITCHSVCPYGSFKAAVKYKDGDNTLTGVPMMPARSKLKRKPRLGESGAFYGSGGIGGSRRFRDKTREQANGSNNNVA